MASRADYACPEHGTYLEDLVFDHTPPGHITQDSVCVDGETCVLTRKWSPVAIGAVKGAGGSPART